MSTKKQRRQKKGVVMQLEECRRQLRERLEEVQKAYATEHREEHAVALLSERARQAFCSLKNQCQSAEKERLASAKGAPELYWMARGLSAETQALFRRLELSELDERARLLEKVQERFRRLLPESVIQRLRQAAASPGEVVVELAETEGRNREKVVELLRLEGEKLKMENALELAKIAYANASAMAELSAFENRVLDVSPTLPPRRRAAAQGFGIGFLQEVKEERTSIEMRLRTMEEELRKMRNITVEAVNALEDPLARPLESKRLVEECELLAVKYLKGRFPGRRVSG